MTTWNPSYLMMKQTKERHFLAVVKGVPLDIVWMPVKVLSSYIQKGVKTWDNQE